MNGNLQARSGLTVNLNNMQKLGHVKIPSNLLHIIESYSWFTIWASKVLNGATDGSASNYTDTAAAFRHSGSANTLFVDGHVSQLKKQGYSYKDEMWNIKY